MAKGCRVQARSLTVHGWLSEHMILTSFSKALTIFSLKLPLLVSCLTAQLLYWRNVH